MKPIPIIYLHHEKVLGGAPFSLLYLLRFIDRKKYSPHILCLRDGPAANMFREEGFPVQIVPGLDLSHTELVWFRWWHFPKLFFRLLQSIPLFFRLRSALSSLKKTCPSEVQPIVHLNSSTLIVGALAAKSLSLPIIWHVREPLAQGYFGIRRAILQTAMKRLPDHMIAISHNDAKQLGTIPSTQLSVIYNFIDFTQFDSKHPVGKIRKELQIENQAPIILFLGGSAQVKGAEILLRAAPLILKEIDPSHLIIAGEISDAFRTQVSNLTEFHERIHLLPSRRDVPSLIVDSSVVLFPSTVPHFARPVIEAAAMSKPVIASDIDGVRELVIPEKTAILVPPCDPDALAQAVIRLLQDPARAEALGREGLLFAQEKFDARQNAKVTFDVYEQVLKKSF